MDGEYFFEARDEDEHTDAIHEYMQEIDVQEGGSDKPIDLSLFDFNSLSCSKVKQNSCLYLQNIVIFC